MKFSSFLSLNPSKIPHVTSTLGSVGSASQKSTLKITYNHQDPTQEESLNPSVNHWESSLGSNPSLRNSGLNSASKSFISFAALCAGLTASFFSTAEAKSVNVHDFSAPVNKSYVLSEDALMAHTWGVEPRYSLLGGLYYDYIHRPLVELNANRTNRLRDIVTHMHSLNLGLGYFLWDGVQIGATPSFTYVSFPDGTSKVAFNDLNLFAKFKLNSDYDPVTFAVMPILILPTGQQSAFTGTGGVAGGLKLIAEHDFGSLKVVGNAGYLHSPNAEYRDLSEHGSIPLSLSTLIPLGSKWALNAEANGEVLLPFNNPNTPSMFYLGARYKLPNDLTLVAGGGLGSVNNYSSANARAVVGLIMAPHAKEMEKVKIVKVIERVEVPAPQPPQRVVFTAKKIVINEEVKFEYNKARLTQSGQNLLDEVGKVMKENDKYFDYVMIEGHTDESGTVVYNQTLSEARAASVREYLIGRGVVAEKLKSVGYGKSRLKLTAKDRVPKDVRDAANRRVEFNVFQTSDKTKDALKDLPVNPVTTGIENAQQRSTSYQSVVKKKNSSVRRTSAPKAVKKPVAPRPRGE